MECETLHFNDQVAVDIGPDKCLVAIEILDASELIPNITVENLTVTR